MPDPDTRVWLLRSGTLVVFREFPAPRYVEWCGGWSSTYPGMGSMEGVKEHDSLPEGAQPMVPIPPLGTDVFRDEEGGIVCGHVTMHRDSTVQGMRTVIAQHAASLTRAYAALEFLEREAAAVSVPVQPECVPPHTGPDCSPDCENVAPGIPVTPESLEAHAEWLAECRPLAAEDLRGEAKRLRAEAEQAAAEQVSADARRKVLEDLKPGVYAVKRYDMMHKRMKDGGTVVVTPDGRYLVHDADSGLAEPVGLYESSWVENMTLLAEGDLSPVVSE